MVPDTHIEHAQDDDSFEENKSRHSTTTAKIDLIDSSPRAPSPRNSTSSSNGRDGDDDTPCSRGDSDVDVESPWDGYDAPRQDPPKRIRRVGRDQNKWVCSEHGPICRSGICAACARIERDMRWKEEREEREERIRIWKAQTEKATLKRARGKAADAEGGEASPGNQPPNFMNGSRGRGNRGRGNSSSRSDDDSSGTDGSNSRPRGACLTDGKYLTLTRHLPPGERERAASPDTPPTPTSPLLDKDEDAPPASSCPHHASSATDSEGNKGGGRVVERKGRNDSRSVANARPTRPTTTKNNNNSRGTGASSSSVAAAAQPQSAHDTSIAAANGYFIPLQVAFAQGGFPTYEDTQWADPITTAQSSAAAAAAAAAAAKAASKAERQANANANGQTEYAGRRPRGRTRNRSEGPAAAPDAAAATTAQAPAPSGEFLWEAPQATVEEAVLPPSGAEEPWGDPNEVW